MVYWNLNFQAIGRFTQVLVEEVTKKFLKKGLFRKTVTLKIFYKQAHCFQLLTFIISDRFSKLCFHRNYCFRRTISFFLLHNLKVFTNVRQLYPHNFERALKSMTCVRIGSIHIDKLKNVKKNQNGTPLPW